MNKMDSAAESCLSVAETVMEGRNRVDLYEGIEAASLDLYFSVVRLSLDFASRSKGFQLRALVEGWDQQRLVREMY